ncbi:hypothetical protein QE152_g34330 [Popillia japonica]|uniref:CCHC-type domain-containing protein n=1 Tax=Popillia japonica TaxID=7064 RepID=A0AAW1IUD2_POPJA
MKNKIKCYRCGGESHLANKCNHKNSTCYYCHKKGHIQKVCLKAKSKCHATNSTNLVEETDDSDDNDSNVEFLANIHSKLLSKLFLTVKCNNIDVKFEIDSGSPLVEIGFVKIECKGTAIDGCKLYIVDADRQSLVGRDWIQKMNLNWMNPNLVIDSHPIPTVEELFTDMSGGEKFTKIDLSQAYLQLDDMITKHT